MFTGIISAVGVLLDVIVRGNERQFLISSPYAPSTITIGASIAHDGCCLTVIETGEGGHGFWHKVDVSPHTLAHTTLGSWQVGQSINLERALRAGDELGGHMVSGHVDGVATLRTVTQEGGSVHYTVEAPDALLMYIADKGSVTLDGTSLTVTWVQGNQFGLTLIPHTLQVTTWGSKRVGDFLNLEVDVMARYAARMLRGFHLPV
jgi:riboflavin synthase